MRKCIMVGGLKLPQLTRTVGRRGAATPIRQASLSVGRPSEVSLASAAKAMQVTHAMPVLFRPFRREQLLFMPSLRCRSLLLDRVDTSDTNNERNCDAGNKQPWMAALTHTSTNGSKVLQECRKCGARLCTLWHEVVC